MKSISIIYIFGLISWSCAFSPSFSIRDGVPRTLFTEKACSVRGSALHMDTSVLTEAWVSYNHALETDPLLTKSITAGVILGAADLAGQALERSQKKEGEESSSVDLARAVRFAFFGLVLQAPWNHFYYQLLDGALPPTADPFTTTTGIKVAIDQFVQAPVFTVLIFYFLGLLEGKTMESVKQQLDNDYKDTMIANWKLWVPATAVNIAFCPPLLRVLFLNCVFFFWSIFLSLKLNKEEEEV
uniref:Peroxisomal membrane protein MPV17 n=1 Tax=Eucampia antarctica TaxID=49252 RepID=A0A7S2W2E8_9STRA|mmetsp:Transcript_18145/g.17525  ORF Transcript_18145/g.17525 Transcript_18145/m.17525 type:complete len:242 (+) Transcript_18145:171-896(+)|eukprot:CAMPEP_0197837434 /NCGR_PEP_ID=MMETSP1437-20131217/32138_1 /TAXON_ID=49252 ORGANISM="Eucampia antarctica, Strain CCMP1452" /NCGR_SAMPLE_ID=MMETSP1437 /ASSEMBLY_ACC=CAM_ASM_001096 /LENGTH=241 /DNA_ID=CAMNT_0043444475 /DNA_START=168 /DNA_END=893 /DNA_ORIENTATION=+